jgi:hypothetical protein
MQRDRKETSDEPPPPTRNIRTIVNPVTTSNPEVLAGGLDSIRFSGKPRLLRFSTQPLRPKMAIGTAGGPLQTQSSKAASGAANGKNGHKPNPDQTKNTSSRITTRSMLHLEADDRTSDMDGEAPSLFGKIGGLFGKKSRR